MIVDGIPFENIERLVNNQRRCLECGTECGLETHHRIFRSTKNNALDIFLREQQIIYEKTYNKALTLWGMHSIQNLVRLCGSCHGKIHNGNRALREKYKYSFTCPKTGYNVPFQKKVSLY